ncbi:MAG: RHS repeat-associated core domain-containing protein [Spirochaetaceae bacterium]|jgi:RHS repeat-associated protein|nr:RHS repeat-associated core domain-containing protein [Spirochaetaceae bacterium]
MNDNSEVVYKIGNCRIITEYVYRRRTIAQDEGGDAMRTLYDGFTFEALREGVTFRNGTFTTKFSSEVEYQEITGAVGTRYRWLGGEETTGVRTQRIDGDAYTAVTARYTGTGATLYGRGEAVAVSRSAGANTRGGTAYLGKDVLGSVRGVSNEWGQLEERYKYDAFGKPYNGDFSNGVNFGYTGKPYDTVTGLYNYGYRDYQPETARFTTVDPVRDGTNWFAYVNNDPVNYTDPLGLQCVSASDKNAANKPAIARGIGLIAGGLLLGAATIFETVVTVGLGVWNDPVTLSAAAALVATGVAQIGAALTLEVINSSQSTPTATEARGKSEKAQPASEKKAIDMRKQIERDLGQDAGREFHDMKQGPDRTEEQLKEDAESVYSDYGKPELLPGMDDSIKIKDI